MGIDDLATWAGSRLRCAPTHTATVRYDAGERTVYVTTTATRERPCSRCERGQCKCEVDLQRFVTDVDTDDVRVALVVALVGDALHEALEHVTWDGARIIDPHDPEGELLASVLHVYLSSILNRRLAGESIIAAIGAG